MSESDRFVHIYRFGDLQLTVSVISLTDGREAETAPVYRSALGNSEELSLHIETAFKNTGLTTSNTVNPWQVQEGENLYHANRLCEVAWTSTAVRVQPYRLVIDEDEDERGWVEDTRFVMDLGDSSSFHDIALEVCEYLKKGENHGRTSLADNSPVTGSTDPTTRHKGNME